MNASRLTRSGRPASATLGAMLFALALTAAGPPQLSAQSPSDTSAAQHIRQQVLERWIHQDRPAQFVRFQRHVRSFELREIQGRNDPPDGRRWTVASDNRDAEVTLDSLGRVTLLEVQLPRLSAWSWTVMRRRAPDEAPAGYAGGGSLTLMETDEGWVVVGRGGWIS